MNKTRIAMKSKKDVSLISLVLRKIDAFTLEEFVLACEFAETKLQDIIEREGDGNGERLKPYYLSELIAEQIQMQRFYDGCIERYKKAAMQTSDLAKRHLMNI